MAAKYPSHGNRIFEISLLESSVQHDKKSHEGVLVSLSRKWID